tara:strand:+ start:226 stop:813 length:588 start_codon:yes stop_codon:yes gene_type:complete
MIRFILIVFLFIGGIAHAQDGGTDGTTGTTTDDGTIKSESTVTSSGSMETTINSPPPSAISPQINMSNSDLCTVGISGAVQTQILGISAGKTVRDMNCEKLKNAKTMYDMGMKVAAVSVMCQDERIFSAMLNAGTPCPKDGLVGDKARLAWEMQAVKEEIQRDQRDPMRNIFNENSEAKIGLGVIISTLAFLLLL